MEHAPSGPSSLCSRRPWTSPGTIPTTHPRCARGVALWAYQEWRNVSEHVLFLFASPCCCLRLLLRVWLHICLWRPLHRLIGCTLGPRTRKWPSTAIAPVTRSSPSLALTGLSCPLMRLLMSRRHLHIHLPVHMSSLRHPVQPYRSVLPSSVVLAFSFLLPCVMLSSRRVHTTTIVVQLPSHPVKWI